MHEDYPSGRVLSAEERHRVKNETSRELISIIRVIVCPPDSDEWLRSFIQP
jgi:hypothetical protein